MKWIIRPIQEKDSQGLNQLRRMPGVFENIMSTPAERADVSVEYIAGLDANSHAFVAVTKDDDEQDLIIGLVATWR